MSGEAFDGAQDGLNRMRRAHERGTGCHLTAEMIASLAVTIIGQAWNEPDPRDATPHQHGAGNGEKHGG